MTSPTGRRDERRWPRPVPVVGDPTSARERAADPAGWALPPATRDALHEVVDARRDVRRYRPDPVPDEVLRRVLTAGHHGPSVGHSQPWRFVVVTDATLRDRAALLADRERIRQADLLDPDAARRLLDLQLEGIREAPLGLVVCCDRRTAAAGVLGRATFPDADLWSCACAIENIWLAARAEGLGMGWVTLFEPAQLARLLDLPDGVVTLGWLCLGWPDERPPEPGLVRAGWSRRVPLDDVVVYDRWPTAPAAPPPPVSRLRAPGQSRVVAARDDADELLTTPGSLGVLDRAVDRVLALAHPHRDRGVLLVAAADHPVTVHGVSAYDPAVTRDVVEATVAGRSLGAALAASAGFSVAVVDAGVRGDPVPGAVPARPRHERGDLVHRPALDERDVHDLLAAGRELGAHLAGEHGVVALGEVGIGNTTVAAGLAGALLGLPAARVVGLGAASDTATVDRKQHVVDDALARARLRHDVTDPRVALAEVGGPEIAVLAGVVLGAAAERATLVLDGMVVTVAALVAARLEPAAQASLVAGQRSREQGHHLLLVELGLEPLLDLRIRAGEGAGAVLAAELLATALDTRRTVARVGG